MNRSDSRDDHLHRRPDNMKDDNTMYRNSPGLCGSIMSMIVSLLLIGMAMQVALAGNDAEQSGPLRIGWASADLTPEEPVVLTGFSRARVSEGVMDPITATVLVIESVGDGDSADNVIMVSCDVISISDELRDRARAKVIQAVPEIDSDSVVLNATHTHCGPETRTKPIWRRNSANLTSRSRSPGRVGAST